MKYHYTPIKISKIKNTNGNFPGSPVDKIPCPQCRSPGSIPGSHMPEQKWKMLYAITESQHCQINK